jgi:hypothetical protein
MSTSADRGFAFRDLPTVIDPVAATVEVGRVVHPPAGGETPEPRCVVYRRIKVAHGSLPCVRDIHFANVYGDDEDWTKARSGLVYGQDGVLHAILYRDREVPDAWAIERLPEEFTGDHATFPSVRFMFADAADARRVAELACRLQGTAPHGIEYPGMKDEAQELINLVVGRGSEPRFVAVAGPVQSVRF